MIKTFPTSPLGSDCQRAMSLDVTNEVVVLSGFNLHIAGAKFGMSFCWFKSLEVLWKSVSIYNLSQKRAYVNWVVRANTHSISSLSKLPITSCIMTWTRPEAANAIRTRLWRFQISPYHKTSDSYSSKDFGFMSQRLAYSFKSAKMDEGPMKLFVANFACSAACSAATWS